MGSQAIEAHREGAEVYHGAALCAEKSTELLAEAHLPLGLLPLAEMEEVGFKQIGRQVSYAAEVTAFVEDRRMKRMTGVKTKELLIWVTLCDMFVEKDDHSKITFKTPTGLGRTFPVAAFAKEGDDGKPSTKDAPAAATAAAAAVSGK
ncbi:hypothetical protein HU200_055947 [Digitaria exilis]|uniref:DUF538 family protein n=1 Tax=Digitaria exilis TaxID=1010633 RepID=A0A835AFS0_9POAL|nr:hypothetical protein HU200_055947 [Digitaria exilis]